MQHPFGAARITYPQTVALSDADPATSVRLPARLARVPGVVSRPVRIGADSGDFYRSTSDALLRGAQIIRVMDPNTPPPAAGSAGYPSPDRARWETWGGGSSWLLPVLGVGAGILVLTLFAGRR